MKTQFNLRKKKNFMCSHANNKNKVDISNINKIMIIYNLKRFNNYDYDDVSTSSCRNNPE